MTSVLHRPPESADTAPGTTSGSTRPAGGAPQAPSRHRCPECSEVIQPVHPRQLFCSTAHKTAFHNRWTVRGRALAPVAVAARITRDGSTGDTDIGKKARRESRHLMDRWAREDREAGRMTMVDYMRERWRIGY